MKLLRQPVIVCQQWTELITDYLEEVPRPVRPPDAPLGGRWVH